jgi:hypothetical protein
MRDLATPIVHLLVTIARLYGPGGARSVVAESQLVKHQLLILNRSRKRVLKLQPAVECELLFFARNRVISQSCYA